MKIMGIESSCDETGVGIVELREDGHMDIIANAVASSMEQHARFGGVVPEIASRAHLEAMPQVMQAALNEAGIEKPDAIAATVGPGLAGALLVGASAAKAYAAAWGVPFYGVNHLGGHVAVANLEGEELPHSVALLVSGGHTQLLEVEAVGKPMRELGSTLDDAVARYVERAEKAGETISVEDVCASFQEAVADVLTAKAVRACEDTGARVLLLGGGVAANSRLRELAAERCAAAGVELRVPRFSLCTDNGVMIAAIGAQLIHEGAQPSGLGVGTDTQLDVEEPQLT